MDRGAWWATVQRVSKELATPEQVSMDMSQEGKSRSHKADRNRISEVLFCHFCCIAQVKVNHKDRPDSKGGKIFRLHLISEELQRCVCISVCMQSTTPRQTKEVRRLNKMQMLFPLFSTEYLLRDKGDMTGH